MSKEIRKNRVEFIRYLYSLPDPDRSKTSTAVCNQIFDGCLCIKGHAMLKFGDLYPNSAKRLSSLAMMVSQWKEMEVIYEGWGRNGTPLNFKQVANWLQTLPGWPTVL